MAGNQNVVRTLTVRQKSEGGEKVAADLNKTAQGLDNVAKSGQKAATVTEDNARRQLSMAKSLESLERRFVAGQREAQQFARVQEQVNRIIAQNPQLQSRANAVLAAASQNLNQAASANRAFAVAQQAANDNLQLFASRLGPLGSAVSALGPTGLAAAAAMAALAIGFKQASDAALALGDRAGQLRDMSETIGFTVEQLQALQIAAGQSGVSTEQLNTGLERFSSTLAEIRTQSGAAFEALEAINPALARQVATANSVQEAWNLVAEAFKTAGREEANFAARALFGRGGVGLTRVAGATELVGGVEAYTDALRQADLITQQQAEHWDDLRDAISQNTRIAEQLISSVFTGPVLEALERASELFLELARASQEVPWEGIADGVGRVAEAFRLAINPVEAFLTLFERLSGIQIELSRASATGSPIGLPSLGINPTGSPSTGSPAGLPDVEALNRRYDELSKKVKQARKDNLDFVDVLRNNVNALGDAATASERYELQVAELAKKLQEGTIRQDTFNRAVRNLDPTMKALQDVVSDLGTALAQAFINGKNGADALNASLKSIAATSASSAINNLIKGDFAAAGTSALISVGSFLASTLFGDDSQQNEQQAQQAAQAQSALASQISQFQSAAASSATRPTTQAGALAAFDAQAQTQRQQLLAQTNTGLVSTAQANAAFAALEQKLSVERLAIIEDFAQRALEAEKAAADRRRAFLDREFAATNDTSTLAGSLAAFERKAAEERRAEAEAGGQALLELDRALAAERLAIERDFADRAAEDARQRAEALQARLTGLNDRLFAAINDATTLEGALVAFDREAQRQREAELRAGGEGLVLLEQTLMVERLNIIEDFNERALAEEKRAAQEREQALAQAARSINDFINNLLTGPQSSLSPQARLAAAQSAYNAQLALAQGGNIAAQQGITQFADRLLDAARSVFASTAGFQSIQSAVIAQLQGLPAVTEPPAADVVGAINQFKAESHTDATIQKGVLDIIDASTSATTAQVTTANALQTTANALLNTTTALLGAIKAQTDFLSAINGNTQGIDSDTNTMISQLSVIQSNTGGVVTTNALLQAIALWTPGSSHATGGWITGGIPGRDSVRLASGGLGMPGEFVVRTAIAQANATWLPMFNRTGQVPSNDNGDIVVELRALRRENAQLQVQVARLIREADQHNVAVVGGQTREMNAETRRASEHEAIKRRRSAA